MKYFSGFCFSKEEELFKNILYPSDFNVAGFSYGAIKAIKYALTCKTRIDTLQLISPAFFHNKKEKYKKLQTRLFEQDTKLYCQNFLKNVVFPSKSSLDNYFKQGSLQDLETLLYYTWNKEDLEELKQRGLLIEVYLGEKDKIVDIKAIMDFFQAYATIYIKKEAGHILQK